jgi:pimeloyl-ACP methyl ester carboxylesterase
LGVFINKVKRIFMIKSYLSLVVITCLTVVSFLPSFGQNGLDLPCQEEDYPWVMVHGFLASGDTYEQQCLRLIANGVCKERIFLFDWNSLNRSRNTDLLYGFIDSVLNQSNASKVYLVGHSAGAALSYELLKREDMTDRVAAYIHIAGTPQSGAAGDKGSIPTMNIFSSADLIVKGGPIEGAQNIRYEDLDHYQVATSAQSFEHIYQFVYHRMPHTSHPKATSKNVIAIGGRSVSLGENRPNSNQLIRIFELDPATGFRASTKPVAEALTTNEGFWSASSLKPYVNYEFELVAKSDQDRTIYYYRQPFVQDNPFVYLRSLPPPNSPAGFLLSGLPKDDDQAVFAIFAASRAVLYGRDILTVNDQILSTEEHATPAASTIAWFLYDANKNQQTDLEAVSTFKMFPFLTAIDYWVPTESGRTITASLNGVTIPFVNYKSKSEGISVIVFD